MKSDDHTLELRDWKFQIDQDDHGLKEQWYAPAHDRGGWCSVIAPQAWDFYAQAMRDYQGIGWYATIIPGSAVKKGLRHELVFHGVGGHAQVFINGTFAGENRIRYLPFTVAAEKYLLNEADNLVVVRCDNVPHLDSLPGAASIEWVLYGGLIQKVMLTGSPDCRIEHVVITASPNGAGGTLKVRATIENNSTDDFTGEVVFAVDVEGGFIRNVQVTCRAQQQTQVNLAAEIGRARPWDTVDPVLYTLKATLERGNALVHSTSDRFGFRTIERRGSEIFLNGRPLFIKGVCRYDEYDPYGPCAPEELVREDILHIKQCGANLVRIHYPQSPLISDVADEIGLLFMQEVPICWWLPAPDDTVEKHAALLKEAHEALTRMYRRDCNHPSWILLSMSNESYTHTLAGLAGMRSLLTQARELDGTRLMSWVCNRVPSAEEFIGTDLVCLNLYYGVFHGEVAYHLAELPIRIEKPTREHLSETKKRYPDLPILVTEFGAAGVRGLSGDIRLTETFQAEFNRVTWKTLLAEPHVRGAVLWCWADYHHQRDFVGTGFHIHAPFGPYGVVTVDRKIKDESHQALLEMFSMR